MYEKAVKRLLDIVLCSFACIVLFPIYLLTAVSIKLSSRGPVFYHSMRAGKDRRPFRFYKFRSMHVPDEKHRQKDLYTADEDRLFPVGRVIRRLKIDELPQLFNVIRGDMSIVGPRPMPVSSVDWQYCGPYADILKVKPGLTSAASLYDYTVGDSYAGQEEKYREIVVPNKLKLEKLYVERQSFSYDASLVWRTIKTILMVLVGKKSFPEQPEMIELERRGAAQGEKA